MTNLHTQKGKALAATSASQASAFLNVKTLKYINGASSKNPWLDYFNRDLLPSPGVYYRAQGLVLRGGGEWKSAICPFHKDTKPSLYVRIDNGAFKCMACGTKGGDILAFHRLRYKLGFKDAARALGTWRTL